MLALEPQGFYKLLPGVNFQIRQSQSKCFKFGVHIHNAHSPGQQFLFTMLTESENTFSAWYDECQKSSTAYHERCQQDGFADLFPWQRTTLAWMADMESKPHQTVESLGFTTQVTCDAPGGFIASAVGTGKTAIVVSYTLTKATVERPVLLIVPPQVEQQWVDEFERVARSRNMPLSVQGKANVMKKRKRNEPVTEDNAFVVWRCSTVTYSRRPPVNWRVLLVTYNFIARRAEALRNKSPFFDFAKWVEEAPAYAKTNGIGTVFHDRQWGAIVYDELTEVIEKVTEWVHKFMNTIPADHVWGLSSTPRWFDRTAQFLRLRRTAPLMHCSSDVTLRYVLYGWSIWPSALLTRSIRFSKEVMPHVRVTHRVALLELNQTEKEVLNYLRNYMTSTTTNDLLICTDVSTLMAQLVGRVNPSSNVDEGVVHITKDQFWAAMREEVYKKTQSAEQELIQVTSIVTELGSVVEALVGLTDAEASNVRVQLNMKQRRVKELTNTLVTLNDQCAYIESLKTRVHEAETNPCPICMEPIEEGKTTVTPCAHVFCEPCITPWVRQHQRCPMCRTGVQVSSMNTLVEEAVPNGQPPEQDEETDPSVAYSTKIQFLITQLRILCTQTSDKAIVFCDYASTVNKVKAVLRAEGIFFTDVVGNIFSKNRKLKVFRHEDTCRVLFLHTSIQNSGMDLFNANHIFFMNSAMSSAVVQQAIGRCVRLSQTKDVNVTFLVIRDLESLPDLQHTLGPFYEGVPQQENNLPEDSIGLCDGIHQCD